MMPDLFGMGAPPVVGMLAEIGKAVEVEARAVMDRLAVDRDTAKRILRVETEYGARARILNDAEPMARNTFHYREREGDPPLIAGVAWYDVRRLDDPKGWRVVNPLR